MFEPVAVVGRGCVLPGALGPEAFWHNIVTGVVSTSTVPSGRWMVPDSAVERLVGPAPAAVRSAVGGYVEGFAEVFQPEGFLIGAEEIAALEPTSHWVLHSVRAALREAGVGEPGERAGLVFGNLMGPTEGMVRYAEDVWTSGRTPLAGTALSRRQKAGKPRARNRFSASLPAHVAARALGFRGGAYALDAACASSLYAIKLACDRLQCGEVDLMVAGGVNQVDDLALRMALSALTALSPSGLSRPFHRDADGMVPAEGAAFVALMRLSDALAEGRRVLGVIRGIGLSNDGRGAGPFAPSPAGQISAIRQAYAEAGIAPESVSLLECHATGTPIGDVTEVRCAAEVFAAAPDLPIGSAKANVGHVLTAAGAAGLLKVLGAFEAGVRPPTQSADEPIDALFGTPLRLLREVEPWPGVRRAGLSAFGFGGNNAHLVIDQGPADSAAALAPPPRPPEVAITAIGIRTGTCASYPEFRQALLDGAPRIEPATGYDLPLERLRIPPADLGEALGQQTALLAAAMEATDGVDLPGPRTTVLVGLECDPESARKPTEARIAADLDAVGAAATLRTAPAGFGTLSAAAALGSLPSIAANRINAQLDLTGPGFAVSAGEASGLVALDLGMRALRAGSADAVVVGAVDLSCDPVHRHAAQELGFGGEPGDAAVVLVLKRLTDARRDGDDVIALLGASTADMDPAEFFVGDAAAGSSDHLRFDPASVFGAPHAAKGLLAVACAATALRHGALPRAGHEADPLLGVRKARVTIDVFDAAPATVMVTSAQNADVAPWRTERPSTLRVFSGADATESIAAARAGHDGDQGPARLVIAVTEDGQLAERVAGAERWLAGRGPRPEGVAFRARPVGGDVAFVYTNGAASYQRMGRDLLLAFPEFRTRLERRCGPLRDVLGWAYRDQGVPHALDQLWGASLLGQLHTELSTGLLGLRPAAALGYSSGETTSLVALGVWDQVGELIAEARRSPLFNREIAGEMATIRRAWQAHGIENGRWAAFLVDTDADTVRSALAGEPAVHLMAIVTRETCVFGGEAAGCARVLARLDGVPALAVGHDIAAHVPEAEHARALWRRLHDQPTTQRPETRFYSCATGQPYLVSRESAADAITAQAIGTIDFVRTVEQAWQDGVRVFVEHGPRNLCSNWIHRILGDREHVAVALDSADVGGLRALTRAVTELAAAGVPVRHDALAERLRAATPPVRSSAGRTVRVPAHRFEAALPDLSTVSEPMPPAPALPPPRAPRTTPVTTPPPALDEPAPPPAGQVRAAAGHELSPHARVAQVHRQFLETRAAAHQRYLAVAARTRDLLLLGRAAPDPRPLTRPPGRVPPPDRTPMLDRAALEALASGQISAVLGPRFRAQDGFRRQVRLPQPPMLLVDRVIAIEAEQGRLGTGTIRTETDVRTDSWYLDPNGRMHASLTVEAGQADLLLISWMGVDLRNCGERVYRLLGCEFTFHGPPPVPGETMVFDIRIDDHYQHGDVLVFSFQYDCRVNGDLRLTLRHGQAGFFTDDELAASGGVLWDPTSDPPGRHAPLAKPVHTPVARSFSAEQVAAFLDGRPQDCFATDWPAGGNHARTPRIAEGRMRLLHEVVEFSPDGGPWGRGYLRARTPISPDAWFFAGHFKDDPCMPGSLMLEGCLQAMAFHLTALGLAVDVDGGRFEPAVGQPMVMRCRGQVSPRSRELVYEVFVAEVGSGPEPTLVADVLCTVDGVRAAHVRRAVLRLVSDVGDSGVKQ